MHCGIWSVDLIPHFFCTIQMEYLQVFNNARKKRMIGALGASPSEINEIEKELGIKFPLAYREFLSILGCHAGRLFTGSHFEVYTLLDLQVSARDLCQDNKFLPLPENAIVFYMHQGYHFNFFEFDQKQANHNPAVYTFCEGQKERDFVKIADSFSSHCMDLIELDIRSWKYF